MTADERIDAIEEHLHSLQAVQADEKLRGVWEHTRAQAEDASSTAATVADTMRTGLQGAYAEVREALDESRARISG